MRITYAQKRRGETHLCPGLKRTSPPHDETLAPVHLKREVYMKMAGKPLDQRMADTEERIRQLQARKQTLSQAIRQQERKDRTRRLILIGGIMAKLGVDTVEKAQALQQQVEQHPEVQQWLSNIIQGM
jgi:hypothetical protein